MQPMLRRVLFASLLIAGAFWTWASRDRTDSATGGLIPAPQKGFSAPDFQLQTVSGSKVALTDYRGKPVLINIWATWCPPCRAEMPTIQKLYSEYQPEGLVVLGVDSTIQDTSSAVPPFAAQYGLTFPILLDVEGQVTYLYELRSLPTSFFVDPAGVIKEVVVGGPMSEAQLRVNLNEILH
jgi:cytochrome c biogenesis protein CcmG, thiol:disulfide interchange protein DsbE